MASSTFVFVSSDSGADVVLFACPVLLLSYHPYVTDRVVFTFRLTDGDEVFFATRAASSAKILLDQVCLYSFCWYFVFGCLLLLVQDFTFSSVS